ncbi:Chaperone protein ClpB4, mitochondrial [Dendrobium catenatum]|uniref:Chaperone protein ClpB4, mitochondrial n=1 Tax=Dendrobium catenatum TaxID=906689 RepID=A0A2I0VAM6_9ASPA|nr:Chaperone protein ClpB4, mitochondrial [Dendrobium catenatum]
MLKQKKIDLQYSKEVVELLGTLGFDPNFRARPVKGVIQQMVENEVALALLREEIMKEESVLIDALKAKLIIRKLENGSSAEVLVANH